MSNPTLYTVAIASEGFGRMRPVGPTCEDRSGLYEIFDRMVAKHGHRNVFITRWDQCRQDVKVARARRTRIKKEVARLNAWMKSQETKDDGLAQYEEGDANPSTEQA